MKFFKVLSFAVLASSICNFASADVVRKVFDDQVWLDQKVIAEAKLPDAQWLTGKKHWQEKRHELFKEWLMSSKQFQTLGETHRMILSHDLTELEWFLVTELPPNTRTEDCKHGAIELQGNFICLFQRYVNYEKNFEIFLKKINEEGRGLGLVFSLPTEQEVYTSVISPVGSSHIDVEGKNGKQDLHRFLSQYHPQPELIGKSSTFVTNDDSIKDYHLRLGHTYFFHHLRHRGHHQLGYGGYLSDDKIPTNLSPMNELVGPYIIQEFPTQSGMKDGIGLWALHLTTRIRIDKKNSYSRDKDMTYFWLAADFYVSLVNPLGFPNECLNLLKKPKDPVFEDFSEDDNLNLYDYSKEASLRVVREQIEVAKH